MFYPDGQLAKIGDSIRLGLDAECIVVCDIDGGEYEGEYSEAQWGYLRKGVMIFSPMYGLIHMESPEEDVELISRK